MSEKHKKTYKYLKNVEHLLILVSTVTGCVSISAFTSLVCVPVGTTLGCIRNKNLWNQIDSYISHDGFISVNKLLRKYNEINNSV